MTIADTLRDVDTISQYLGLTHNAPYPEDRQRAREALTRLSADAARVGELREVLELIVALNKVQEWTATDNNPETHWEVRDGQYAAIARAALAKDHSR